MIRAILSLACVFIAAQAPKSDVDKEVGALQGEWVVVSTEIGGEKVVAPAGVSVTTVIRGNKYSIEVPTEKGERTFNELIFKVDPSRKPKAIDFTAADGTDEGKPSKGIYLLEGDTLKICFNPIDRKGERPAEFATEAGSKVRLIIYKRKGR